MVKENWVEKEAVELVLESRKRTGLKKKALPNPARDEEGGGRQVCCGVREMEVFVKWASPKKVMLGEGEKGVE